MSDTKPTNPKDAIGSAKLPLHLWPTTATITGALALLDGALKYGRQNWREAGVRYSIYYDAARRHMDAAFEGEDADPDSGLPHEAHALACLAIIVDARATGKLIDDRAYNGGGYRAAVADATAHVGRLQEKHAGRDPRHFTIADDIEQLRDEVERREAIQAIEEAGQPGIPAVEPVGTTVDGGLTDWAGRVWGG